MFKTAIPFAPLKSSIKLFSLLLLLVASVIAQDQTGRPERGTGGVGTRAAGEIDSINLQNGNVSLQIPLATLPRMAGGKLGYTLTAYYNSKIWNSYQAQGMGDVAFQACDQPYPVETVAIAEGETGGWKIGGQYEIIFREAWQDYDYFQPDNSVCFGNEFYLMDFKFFKPILKMPDGSEHEMRIDGSFPQYAGNNQFLSNYYKFQTSNNPNPFSSIARLYTVDGTFITATYDASGNYKIYLEDGTIVENAPGGQRIRDTNGNSILVTSSSAKDEHTNREIKWSNTTYNGNGATKVEYQSVGGTWQAVWVVWGSTTVEGQIYRAKDWDPFKNTNGDECDKWKVLNAGLEVVRDIIFPQTAHNTTPQKYTFEYNSDSSSSVSTQNVKFTCNATPSTYTRAMTGMGGVSEVTLPSGAQLKYYYGLDPSQTSGLASGFNEADRLVADVVVKKEVLHDGTSEIWEYDIPTYSSGEQSTLTNPDGSTYVEKYHPTDPYRAWQSGTNGLGGLTYRTTNGRVMTEKKWTLLGGSLCSFAGGTGSLCSKVSFNSVVDTEYTSLLDASGNRVLMSAKKFDYDYNGELTQTVEYDWFSPSSVTFASTAPNLPTAIPSGATILRVTGVESYNQAANISSSNAYQKRTLGTYPVILGKPKEVNVGDGTTIKSTTRFSYDAQSFGTAPTLGNLTNTCALDSVTSACINTVTTYTARGNVATVTDGNSNVTQFSYGSIGGYSDLYPTQTVAAHNTSVARTSSVAYDFYTGLPTSTTDEDNDVTNTVEYDILLRPIKTISADNSALESWNVAEYHDNERFVVSKSDLESLGDGKKVGIQHFDMLGRVVLARTLEDAATEDPADPADGIKVETKYLTDVTGYTYQLTSNPYRTTSDATFGWTRSKAWSNGMKSEIETFSGATPPAPWGSNASSTGKVSTDRDANRTLVTDQALKQRISVTNSIGHLKEVWEILSASETGSESISFPSTSIAHGFKTTYDYDVLNNLTHVDQGDQDRDFSYSSLSRLLSANNPESGLIRYSYDSNGNLKTKWDARGIKTIYDYDQLNRIKKRCYRAVGTSSLGMTTCTSNAETMEPNSHEVAYTYDNVTNAKGKLTKVESSVSTTEYLSFDILGRVTRSKQTTDGVEYGGGSDAGKWMTYSYNLAGALTEQQYPSGRVVRNTLDDNGDLMAVLGRKTTHPQFWAYANGFDYDATGAVRALQLGNGLWESTVFNSRLQPTQIALGTASNPTSLLDLGYTYGASETNNGNLLTQTINVASVGAITGFSAVQTYNYDSLNRLKDATENLTPTNGSTTQTWKQTFKYDRYGNRRFDFTSNNTTTPVSTCTEAICNPTISTSNNKITSSGYSFDSSGNTTADANGRTFVYDGESKQIEVRLGSSTLGQYWYDGEGKRIKKYVPPVGSEPGETTVFLYDAFGKLIGEYSTVVAPTNDAKVAYLTSDHLGSPRINTDKDGTVATRHDYHPFGEDISTSQRTVGLKYDNDAIRKQYTGYERDKESSLEFAQARYFTNVLGRFSSSDRENIGSDPGDPQSWNGYSYASNNPLNIIDPSGLIWLRLNKTDNYYWVDDDVYEKNKGKYKDYTPSNDVVIRVTGGTQATPDQIGQNVVLSGDGNAYTISDSDLALGTVVAEPDPVISPFQELGIGAEVHTLWLWRPLVYLSTAALLPAAAPMAGGGGGAAAGGALMNLGLRAAPAAPTGLAALNQLLNSVPRWEKLTSKAQGFVQGNAQQIFDSIAHGGTKISPGVVQMSDGRFVTLYNSSTNGVATIQVAGANVEKVVIRITP